MSIHHALHNNLLDNPIQRRENLTLNRQRGKWSWRIMYSITALIMLIPILWGFGKHFNDSVGISLGLLTFANVVIFILVVVRTVTNASDSMYRERRGKTWELLMLTGVSNWRVVLGKWGGIMRHLARDYFWLYLIRIGTLFWLSVSVNLNNDFSYNQLAAYNNSTVSLFDIRIGGTFFVVAAVLLLTFTVLELMLSSSIGLAVAFFKFKVKTSSAVGTIIRVGLAVLIPILTYLLFAYADGDTRIFAVNESHYDESVLFFTLRTSTIFADNGVISTIAYADSSIWIEDILGLLTFANFAGIAMYLTFTGIALGVAANRAFVRGLDFGNGHTAKIKRKRPIEAETIQSEPIVSDNTHTVTIAAASQNVFNLEHPEQLSVDIHHYQRRLGRMVLRITGEDLPVYIQLSNVAYMEAPAFWKGANFRTASDADYHAFVQEKGIYINGLTEESMRLYVLDDKTSVRIVAGTAQILEELPDNL